MVATELAALFARDLTRLAQEIEAFLLRVEILDRHLVDRTEAGEARAELDEMGRPLGLGNLTVALGWIRRHRVGDVDLLAVLEKFVFGRIGAVGRIVSGDVAVALGRAIG